MGSYNSSSFQIALDEADMTPAPLPGWQLTVGGEGRNGSVELWSLDDVRPLLKALARETGEPLATIVSNTWLDKREYQDEDTWSWVDVTPPELGAWGWPELEQNTRKKRGSRRRR